MSILFHRKKEEMSEAEAFRQKAEKLLLQLAASAEEREKALEALSADIRQMGNDIRKHDMALEDCLELLEEQQEALSRNGRQDREWKEEQERLLELLGEYQEQTGNMKKYAKEKDPAWFRQLEMIETAVRGKRMACGIVLIEETGVCVDYALHEVIEVRETEEEQKDKTVAEVCSPGWIYRGNIRKKAKVAAYRFKKENGRNLFYCENSLPDI